MESLDLICKVLPQWRPNKPLELTPLRGPKIAAFLQAGCGSIASRSMGGGAAQRQAVGPPAA
jgi:hypothetical protein